MDEHLINVSGTLDERSVTHGPFNKYSECAQTLRHTLSQFATGMTDVEAEGLNQILGKIARILTGTSGFKDHWHDIAGYAVLVEKHILNTKL